MNSIEKLKDKKILIWGYGREGQSTERFLKEYCKPKAYDVFEGTIENIDMDNYDYIIKSPGIPIDFDNSKIISQTELFLGDFRNQIIGVTGTKGKSTTSSMLFHALTNLTNRDVLLVGNIGKPCLDYYGEVKEDTIIVFEMSCHQLAHINVSPHIAVLLNVFEEHLDYYKTFEKYEQTKFNITKYQNENDMLYLGKGAPRPNSKAKIIEFEDSFNDNIDINVLGEHNKYNANVVSKIVLDILGIEKAKTYESLKTFEGLPHRLQYIGTSNEIKFYDDSISTIPQATIEAVKSVPDVQTVIIGGMDRGIDYSLLIDYINEEGTGLLFVFCYESGKRIYNCLGQKENIFLVKDLEEATNLAFKITDKGKACVLSPAAASYGYFKNFEQRGDRFKEYAGL